MSSDSMTSKATVSLEELRDEIRAALLVSCRSTEAANRILAQLDAYREAVVKAKDSENVSLKQRVQELETALKPFAELAEFWDMPDDHHISRFSKPAGQFDLTFAHMNAAREALGGKP